MAGRQVAAADHSRRFLQIRDQGWREAAGVENRREWDTDARFPERRARIGGPRAPRGRRRGLPLGDEFGDEPVPFYARRNRRRRDGVSSTIPRFVFARPEARTSVTLAIDPSLRANVLFLVACLNRPWARFAYHRNRHRLDSNHIQPEVVRPSFRFGRVLRASE
jgi:hypothetical protein